MPISPNIDDREYQVFAGVQNLTVKNVRPVLADGDSISVDLTVKGLSTYFYNEILSVASGSDVDILTYIVPIAKIFHLSSIKISGSNLAIFTIKLNGSTINTSRTWWTSFNKDIPFGSFRLNAGDTLTVSVLHTRPYTGDFECTIIGSVE